MIRYMADEVVEYCIPVSPRMIDDAVGTRRAVSPRATVEVAESQTPMSPHSQPTQSPNEDKPSPQILDTQSQTQNPPFNPPSAGNTQADHPEIISKMQKLQMPFIANEGQVDECVAFYAKTFGGTVFVTKNGEIVYSLPSSGREAGRLEAVASNPHSSPSTRDNCVYFFKPYNFLVVSDPLE